MKDATQGVLLPAQLEYVIRAHGRGVKIQEVKGTKAGKRGVTSNPWNVAHQFKRSFANGGKLLARLTSRRYPIRKLYGPSIPKEIVKGETLAAFQSTGPAEMQTQVDKRLARLLP